MWKSLVLLHNKHMNCSACGHAFPIEELAGKDKVECSECGHVAKRKKKEIAPIVLHSTWLPFLIPILGLIIGIGTHNDNDWIGAGIILFTLLGLVLGSVFSVVLSIIAYKKRLYKRGLTLISAIPSGLFLFWLLTNLDRI